MPLKPAAGLVTLNNGSPIDLLVDAVRFSAEYSFFERVEFSNARLRQAPASNGQEPVIVKLPGGVPAILTDGCVTPQIRPLGTDVFDDVYKRWDIKRWELQGAATLAANVESIYTTSQDHKARLARFDAHLNKGRANISYTELVAMQAETFSYITTTGLTFSGMPLGTGSLATFTNVLIVQFAPDVDYEEPLNAAGTSSRVLRRFSAVLEQRTLKAQTDPTF